MKNIFKSKLFFVILGALVFSTSVALAYSYIAEEIGFTPIDNEWEVENVDQGLESLYDKATHCDFSCPYNAYDIVFESTYTGTGKVFNIPCKGNYRIELWGAQGGDSQVGIGGKGAYVKGDISFNRGQTIYIYIGGKPTTVAAGYNGGGQTFTSTNPYKGTGGAGGGATDVRFMRNALEDRIMVAGGGGGALGGEAAASGSGNGGAAGGLTGYSGVKDIRQASANLALATGGTQISGGTASGCGSGYCSNTNPGIFGIGGNASDISSGWYSGGGGGGGYYGGGGGQGGYSFGGGGGSSYISGHAGCVAIAENSISNPRAIKISGCNTNPTSNDGCSVHYSSKSFTNTVMIDGAGYSWSTVKATTVSGMPNYASTATMNGNTGNGYAKITYLGIE